MPLADVLFSGLDTVRTYIALYLISFIFIYLGFKEIIYGEAGLGLFAILIGIIILIVGLVGMVTKIIGDGVSWGIYANRSNIGVERSDTPPSSSAGGNPSSQHGDASTDSSGFVSRAKAQFGLMPESNNETNDPGLPPGMKKCKECQTPNDSKLNLRCYICHGELI